MDGTAAGRRCTQNELLCRRKHVQAEGNFVLVDFLAEGVDRSFGVEDEGECNGNSEDRDEDLAECEKHGRDFAHCLKIPGCLYSVVLRDCVRGSAG